jgi:hypothetical protein
LLREALEEFNVVIDRLGGQITNLVGHQGCNGIEEGLCLVLIKVLELLTQDLNS